MDAVTEMVAYGGHVNTPVAYFTPPPAPSPTATTVFGHDLAEHLRGRDPDARAHIAAQFVTGASNLARPTIGQASRLVRVRPGFIHRALGRPPRPPGTTDMVSYIRRFGLERPERLIVQIRAFQAANGNAA
jgi:hypothetical protein